MEFQTVGSKRARMDSADAAQGGGDATVQGMTLALVPQEEALFELLMKVVEAKQLPCVLRVAGGWVRDKIMGKEAHDIDIAIDTMMGQDFTQHLVDYMKEAGRDQEVGSVGVIKSNPDQSKHLETATLRVMGFELDFVNLRAEEYTDTRIPVMRIGTALEDAMRRDLTINALFYNLNRRTVEDFTGQGIQDIKDGMVRTPLAPNSTMIDDPLRALRTVRFACRLGFTLDKTLEETLATTVVRDALAAKVSKERVLTELNGMLLGPDPARALEMLHSFSLLSTVFATPSSGVSLADASHSSLDASPAIAPWDATWTAAGMALVKRVAALSPQVLQGLLRSEGELSLSEAMPKEWTRLLYLTALLAPLKAYQLPGKKKPEPLVEYVLRVSLKGTVKDTSDAQLFLDCAQELRELATSAAGGGVGGGGEGGVAIKVQAGRCLRKVGERWRIALLLALVQAGDKEGAGGREEEVLQRFEALEKLVVDEWYLEGCWDMKPLLDGGKICQTLNLDKKKKEDGIKIGVITREMIDWQLSQAKPLHVTAAECEAWLLKVHNS